MARYCSNRLYKPDIIGNIRNDGYTPVVISDIQKEKLDQQIQNGGPQVITVESFVNEYNQSFQYQFIEPEDLTPSEKIVFYLTTKILALVIQPP